MHSLVKVIAETKVANMARALGSGKGHVRRGAGQSGLPSEEIPVYLLHQSPEPLPPQQAVFSGVGSCGSCRQEGPDPQVGEGQEKGQARVLQGPHQRPWPVSRGSDLCPVDGRNIFVFAGYSFVLRSYFQSKNLTFL
jgi:hypothetical protein